MESVTGSTTVVSGQNGRLPANPADSRLSVLAERVKRTAASIGVLGGATAIGTILGGPIGSFAGAMTGLTLVGLTRWTLERRHVAAGAEKPSLLLLEITSMQKLIDSLPLFKIQEFLCQTFRGKTHHDTAISDKDRDEFINHLKRLYKILTKTNPNAEPEDSLEEFSLQLACLRERLYEMVLVLPESPTEEEERFFEAVLRKIQDEFPNLLQILNCIIFYQKPFDINILRKMLKNEICFNGSVLQESSAKMLCTTFPTVLDEWQEVPNQHIDVFFKLFLAKLANQPEALAIFNHLVYSVQQNWDINALSQIFQDEFHLAQAVLSIQTSLPAELFCEKFPVILQRWQASLSKDLGPINSKVFFHFFTDELQNQPEVLPVLHKLRENSAFLNYLERFMNDWYKNTVLDPMAEDLKINYGELSTRLSSERAAIQVLENLGPFAYLDRKREHLSGGLRALLKECENLNASCKRLLASSPYKELKTSLDNTSATMKNLSLTANQLLNPQNLLFKHMTTEYESKSRKDTSPVAEAAIAHICGVFFNILERVKHTSSTFENIWTVFLEEYGCYTNNPREPLKSVELTLLAWKTPPELSQDSITWRKDWSESPSDVENNRRAHFLQTTEGKNEGSLVFVVVDSKTTTLINDILSELKQSKEFERLIMESLQPL